MPTQLTQIKSCSEFTRTMEKLNKDIVINIFSYLSFSELANASRVCRQWHSMYKEIKYRNLSLAYLVSDECERLIWKPLCESLDTTGIIYHNHANHVIFSSHGKERTGYFLFNNFAK